MSKQPKSLYMTPMLWRSADLKEEEDIHNPIDQLWKLINNQQLFPQSGEFKFQITLEIRWGT